MKKISFFLILWLALSCSDSNNEFNDVLPSVPVNEPIFLNNPEFINLQVVGGWAYAQGGISGLIIYHYNSNGYVAFDRAAPHLTPSPCSKMTVENSIKMVASCDNSAFQIIDGAPMTDGIDYIARQYRVVLTSPTTLQITNF